MTRNEYIQLCEHIVWSRVYATVLGEMEFLDPATASRVVQRLREVERKSKETTKCEPAQSP